jgi:hypothetical protein
VGVLLLPAWKVEVFSDVLFYGIKLVSMSVEQSVTSGMIFIPSLVEIGLYFKFTCSMDISMADILFKHLFIEAVVGADITSCDCSLLGYFATLFQVG